MSEQSSIHVTEADVQSFADKLSAFGATLSEPEQALLVALCQRAAAAGADVAGFANQGGGDLDPIWLRTDWISPSSIFDPTGFLRRFTPEGINRGFPDEFGFVARNRTDAFDI